MPTPLRGLSSNTIPRRGSASAPVSQIPASGLKSSALNQSKYGIQYNAGRQQQLNISPDRFQSQRPNNFRARASSTRRWGSDMHSQVMSNIQKKKDLAEVTRLTNEANQLGMGERVEIPQGGTASSGRAAVGIPTNGNKGIGGTGSSSSFRAQIVDRARRYLGVPYTLGGGHQPGAKTPSRGYNGIYGLDCSGLTGIVYRQMGINLPGIANQQSVFGKRTSLANARPGDLVGWNKGGHIAIYIGGGKILHAPRPGEVVQIRNLFRGEQAFAVQLTLPGD